VHWYGRGRKGENPREVKTQERIGSNRQGNTGRMDVRTLVQLKPLKATPICLQWRTEDTLFGRWIPSVLAVSQFTGRSTRQGSGRGSSSRSVQRGPAAGSCGVGRDVTLA
jgi:hypothetical protein